MTIYTKDLAAGRYRFRHLARMEWIKLRSLPSTWCTLALAVAASAGIAAAARPGHISGTTASSLFVNSALIGMLAGVLLSGVLGVLVMTGEYTSGTILATFAAAPRRPLVLAAKAAVYGAVALITGEAAAFLSFLVARAALSPGITAPTLGDPGVFRAIALTGSSLGLIGLFGLGLGTIIRHTAAAIAVLVGIVYIGELFAGQLNPAIKAYLPIYIVGNSLSVTTPLCRPGSASCPLPVWDGLGILAIYAVIALVLGGCILARRDT
jgi:ABC-2 type transport system permease protein